MENENMQNDTPSMSQAEQTHPIDQVQPVTPPTVPPIIPSDQGINPSVPAQNFDMSKKALMIILASVFVIAGIAYGGMWYWQKQSLNALNNVPIFTPRPTPVDPMAGWKTYTNMQYGFEFKYPYDFIAKEYDDQWDKTQEDRGVNLIKRDLELGLSIDSTIYSGGSPTISYSKEIKNINQIQVQKNIVFGYQILPNGTWILSYGFKNKNDNYVFSTSKAGVNTSNVLSKDTEILMEQILSTFKFTNSNQGQTACTQEAKQCPDGSYVSRTGPNCEFTVCP